MPFPSFVFALFFCIFSSYALAEEIDLINRPINAAGLTGLISTTMPQVLPARTIETGLMLTSENSFKPDYSLTSSSLLIGYGIGRNKEIALHASYWHRQDADLASFRGFGDTELSFKWNIRPQEERSAKPGIALFATGILPTGDKDAGTNVVQHWGMRFGIAVGSEIELQEYILGAYADYQFAVQDLSDDQYRDQYQYLNLGILLPISKYRNLQLLIEYNRMDGQDHPTLHEVDYSAMTYGLRLVSDRFNLTVGAQFLHKAPEGYGDSTQITGMLSVKL
jgi:hypothetical protein